MSSLSDNSGVHRSALWFGLLGGAGAWTAHLLLAYLIAEFACVAGKDASHWLGIMTPAWWLIAMSVTMLLLSGSATLLARLLVRRLRQRNWSGDRAAEAGSYMAKTGYYMSMLFTFIIAAQSIPIFFYLQRC